MAPIVHLIRHGQVRYIVDSFPVFHHFVLYIKNSINPPGPTQRQPLDWRLQQAPRSSSLQTRRVPKPSSSCQIPTLTRPCRRLAATANVTDRSHCFRRFQTTCAISRQCWWVVYQKFSIHRISLPYKRRLDSILRCSLVHPWSGFSFFLRPPQTFKKTPTYIVTEDLMCTCCKKGIKTSTSTTFWRTSIGQTKEVCTNQHRQDWASAGEE